MNTEESLQIIQKVFLDVLEQYAFLLLDPLEKEPETLPENFVQIELSFYGAQRGVFSMIISQEVNNEIEANLSGMDPSTFSNHARKFDGAKEMLNIIGPHILTDLFGNEEGIDISLPQQKSLDQETWKATMREPLKVGMSANGTPLILTMHIK